jgi:hypothetical protein
MLNSEMAIGVKLCGYSQKNDCFIGKQVGLSDLVEGKADYARGNKGGKHAAHYREVEKLAPIEDHD